MFYLLFKLVDINSSRRYFKLFFSFFSTEKKNKRNGGVVEKLNALSNFIFCGKEEKC